VSRIKTLKRLSAVRARMRDAAAAAASQALQREYSAKATRDARENALIDHDASLLAQIAVARPENALELFYADRDIATDALVMATTDWQGRSGESARARAALGARERDLQVAEKLLDEARTERNTRIAKYEQSTADDLAAGRKRRTE
jgi:hypothetical protein